MRRTRLTLSVPELLYEALKQASAYEAKACKTSLLRRLPHGFQYARAPGLAIFLNCVTDYAKIQGLGNLTSNARIGFSESQTFSIHGAYPVRRNHAITSFCTEIAQPPKC